ncbi:HD domain-containing phosphohydrolase [Deinococcus sp. UYEF24]
MTLAGYALTAALLWWSASAQGQRPDASPVGVLGVVLALMAMGATVWFLGQAHSFPVRTAVALAISLSMLADLSLLNGIGELWQLRLFQPWLNLGLSVLGTVGVVSVALFSRADRIARERATHRAIRLDPLTGLFHRQSLRDQYDALNAALSVSVVMLDLNDLKAINDAGGHGVGDAYIQRFAADLQGSLPPEAFAARWGGDEFVIVFPGSAPVDAFISELHSRVRHPVLSVPSFSWGVILAEPGTALERVLAVADQRRHEQKSLGHAELPPSAPATGLNGEDRKEDASTLQLPSIAEVNRENFPQFLLSLTTVEDIVEQGLRKATELAGFQGAVYHHLGPSDEATSSYILTADAPQFSVILPPTLRTNALIVEVVRRRSTVWTADYPQSPYAQSSFVALGLKGMVASPVSANGEVVGVLMMGRYSDWHVVTPQARQLLETVALHLGHYFERQEVVQQLQASVHAGILSLGLILEARDMETAGHTERVVALATRLGQAMDLDLVSLEALRLGSSLHDVGKLAIPDAVLLKPGALNADEWALMKTHTVQGELLTAKLPSLSDGVLEVVRSHHERWDGGGYPDGLVGEAIPLLARIFSVGDVYDALVNRRAYKQAWSRQEARAELAAQRGKQFDPAAIDAFLALPEWD